MTVSRANGWLVNFSDGCQLSAETALTVGSPAAEGGGQPAGPRLPLGDTPCHEWPGVLALRACVGRALLQADWEQQPGPGSRGGHARADRPGEQAGGHIVSPRAPW